MPFRGDTRIFFFSTSCTVETDSYENVYALIFFFHPVSPNHIIRPKEKGGDVCGGREGGIQGEVFVSDIKRLEFIVETEFRVGYSREDFDEFNDI